MTDDIERDLSTVLTRRAGVPPTDIQHALVEHERRMRARSRAVRTRAVAGATAMVALIGVGAALAVDRPAGTPRPLPPATRPVQPPPVRRASDPALKLADFTAQGKQWTAYVMISRPGTRHAAPGDQCVQVVGVPAGAPPTSTDRYPDAEGCEGINVWQNDPLIGQLAVLPASDTNPGPLPDLTVWVTVPAVADISVVRSGGDTVHASPLGTLANVKVFVTSKEIKFAKRYTFRDAHGTILRQDNM